MNPKIPTKSSIMLGIGEQLDEVLEAMDDLRAVNCNILTLGQYLQPTPKHMKIDRYVHPDEFAQLKQEGLKRGFRHVESGPLVRSSYHAHEQTDSAYASIAADESTLVMSEAAEGVTTSPSGACSNIVI